MSPNDTDTERSKLSDGRKAADIIQSDGVKLNEESAMRRELVALKGGTEGQVGKRARALTACRKSGSGDLQFYRFL